LSDDGSICWEVGNYIDPVTSEVYPLDIYFYKMFKDMGLQLRNRIIWHFGHGLQCEKRFSGRYETILWFSKTDKYTFNLDDVRIPSKYPGKKAYKGEKKGKLSGNPKGKNPEDVWKATVERLYDDWDCKVWDIPNVKSQHPEKTQHPCQFPVELVERCVLALTNENDIVYDPFAGVGSSLIAALKNGRQAYGTELMKEYIDIGLERINKLSHDTLKTRPIYQKIYEPTGKDSVSKYPIEWMQMRLEELENIEKQIKQEKKEIKKYISEQ
jgi:DNA modification methylase